MNLTPDEQKLDDSIMLIGRLDNYLKRGAETDPSCLEDIRNFLIEQAGLMQAPCPVCEGQQDIEGLECEFCCGRGKQATPSSMATWRTTATSSRASWSSTRPPSMLAGL